MGQRGVNLGSSYYDRGGKFLGKPKNRLKRSGVGVTYAGGGDKVSRLGENVG